MILARRQLLLGTASLLAAPAIVRASSLMRLPTPRRELVVYAECVEWWGDVGAPDMLWRARELHRHGQWLLPQFDAESIPKPI